MKRKHGRDCIPISSSSTSTVWLEAARKSSEDAAQVTVPYTPSPLNSEIANALSGPEQQTIAIPPSQKRSYHSDQDEDEPVSKRLKALGAEVEDLKALNSRLQEIIEIQTRRLERLEKAK